MISFSFTKVLVAQSLPAAFYVTQCDLKLKFILVLFYSRTSALNSVRMAQKPYCCRTKVRKMFTLCLAAGLTLFLVNIITQIYDIPPSRGNRLNTGELARHELIGKWRKVSHDNYLGYFLRRYWN